MKTTTTGALAAAVFASAMGMAQANHDLSCSEMWHLRNQIYKSYDYCFRTRRALNAFGPNGRHCTRHPRLSSEDERLVLALRARERRHCGL